MVGIVVVSHSSELARGLADRAGQMAGPLDDVVRAAEQARRTSRLRVARQAGGDATLVVARDGGVQRPHDERP
jgi:hypothetical protein